MIQRTIIGKFEPLDVPSHVDIVEGVRSLISPWVI